VRPDNVARRNDAYVTMPLIVRKVWFAGFIDILFEKAEGAR
jgi:hypothetical protein